MTEQRTSDFFERAFSKNPAMVILRGLGLERTLSVASLAWSAGIAVVEIPLQGADSAETLEAVVAAAAVGGHLVGAGTITTVSLAEEAAKLGAAFTVAPGLDLSVAERSRELGMPHLPGVATAGEVQRALNAGHRWQKAFPAASLGPDWIAAMRGPFPEVRFAATGGVSAENAHLFLEAGAGAVSFGTALARMTPEDLRSIFQPRA